MMRPSRASGLAFLVVAASACGGKPGEQLFGYGDPDASAGTGGGGGTIGSSSGRGGAGDEAASSAVATSAQSSSAAQSSAQSSVASTGSGTGDVVVYCKNAPCAAGQVCCFHMSDPNLDACGAPGSCGGDYLTLSCNGPEDCPGGECCGGWNGSFYTGISCVPSCPDSDILMCEGDASVCPPGENCFQSQVLGAGYSYCGTQ